MELLDFREYCLSLPLTEEATPFDETTLVYKVHGKVFSLCDMEDHSWANLKCDPDRAIELRERYEDIAPGFHMNKKHWNTIRLNGDLPEAFIREMVLHSYELVVSKLPKAKRDEVLALTK